MKRYFSLFIIFIFFIWILPLGVFIKKSEEKEVCNGHRAICMCSHAMAQQNSKPLEGIVLKSASGAPHKEGHSSSSSSLKFFFAHQNNLFQIHALAYNDAFIFTYDNPFINPTAPVPRDSVSS